jgi:polyribonucleotide nucleotidyltransferase
MFNVNRVEKQIGDSVISIETGKIARQAHGAVLVQSGETVVMVTATTAKPRFADMDYFPLSVDYREKLSAAGKFPGGFMKREGRPTTKEILTARMIDRPIRPLFPDGYFDEVQIMCNVLSADPENDPDVLAMVGASAALAISKIPFQGPVGACRVSRVKGEFVVNPTHTQRLDSDFNLVLAGRREAINMIEVDSSETAEDDVANGVATAHKAVGDICDLIDELVAKCGVEKMVPEIAWDDAVYDEVTAAIGDKIYQAYQMPVKSDRSAAVKEIRSEIKPAYIAPVDGQDAKCVKGLFNRILDKVEKMAVRKLLLEGKRPDGRACDEIRQIECEVGVIPRVHGSALFTRGETQALVTVTLGTGRDKQIVDGLQDEVGQDFMLHYNFPPFSVGEARPIRGPGRREIGHGALAEKALEAMKPENEKFPYTIKITSEITESNGSSSQASICGGSLAMFDAGVPMDRTVAGISVGMISDENGHTLLTDILGDEDHFGDMDFKVAGTRDGITAIQLDIKAEGLPHDIMVESLQRAKEARFKILDIMETAIAKPRTETAETAPKIVSIKINPDQIGKLIGPGGKMIKSIQESTGAVIEIEEDGTVKISCIGGQGHMKAREIIEGMTTPPKVGKVYTNVKVVSVKDFGVFVELSPGVEGLCHVSELSDGYVKSVADFCKEGDLISVKLLLIDDQGRFKLSRKAALAEMGESDNKE